MSASLILNHRETMHKDLRSSRGVKNRFRNASAFLPRCAGRRGAFRCACNAINSQYPAAADRAIGASAAIFILDCSGRNYQSGFKCTRYI